MSLVVSLDDLCNHETRRTARLFPLPQVAQAADCLRTSMLRYGLLAVGALAAASCGDARVAPTVATINAALPAPGGTRVNVTGLTQVG